MTATGETTLPVTPSVARAPRQDRAGLVWGAVLGTAMLAVALVVALGGGTAPAAGETKLSGEIKINGSSTVFPIAKAVSEAFREKHPDIRITVGDAGTAISAAAAGLGKARVPVLLAQTALAEGRVAAVGEAEPSRRGYWLVAPLPQWRQKKVKALIAALTD